MHRSGYTDREVNVNRPIDKKTDVDTLIDR